MNAATRAIARRLARSGAGLAALVGKVAAAAGVIAIAGALLMWQWAIGARDERLLLAAERRAAAAQCEAGERLIVLPAASLDWRADRYLCASGSGRLAPPLAHPLGAAARKVKP